MKTINLYIQPKMEQKYQAHNLKVVGSNPNPETNLFNKINDLNDRKRHSFFRFLRFMPDNDHRVINICQYF